MAFKDSESYKKLKEHEKDLRSYISIPSEQKIISFIQPINTKSVRQNDNKNELVEQILINISQGMCERTHMTKLLAEIRGQLKNINNYNEIDRKRLSEFEAESFKRFLENKLTKDTKFNNNNSTFDNISGSITLIENKLETLIEKMQNIESQNKDIMRRLDTTHDVYKAKVNESSAVLDELHKMVNATTNILNKTDLPRVRELLKVHENDILPQEIISPDNRNNSSVVNVISNSSAQPSSHWNLKWNFKSRQQLKWEYEENKRELQLLENEGFRSPDFLRYCEADGDNDNNEADDCLDQLDQHLNSKHSSKGKGKRARFSETEYSTEDDLTIEDLC